MYRRTPLALLALTCLGATASAQDRADAPPSTPAGLVAVAYGASAGGIRWERSTDDRGVVGYEVTRDGDVLGTFDALSVVENALRQDTAYAYGVTAIDTAGQRSGTATVSLVTPPSRPDLGPPNPEVRTEVYSSTAAELFWRRPARRLIYTVVRDGTLLYEGDATSYFDDDLEPGRTYVYDVQASDFQGGVSPISQVTLTTPGGGQGGGPGEGSSPDAPPAAAGLRATVYSISAAELFWERASAPGLSYEVSREGTALGTTDGTSFFDDTIPGAGSYAYEVVAVAPDGSRSAPASTSAEVGGGTGSPGPGEPMPPSFPEDYVEVLRHAFEIYTGKRFGPEILDLPGYPIEAFDYDPPGREGDGTVTVVADCEGGGTATLAETVTGDRQTVRIRDFDFDRCRRGSTLYRGDFVERDFGNVQLSSDGFERVEGDAATRFSGGLGYMPMSNRDGGPTRTYGLSEADYSAGDVALADASFDYLVLLGNFRFELGGGYRLTSPFTGGAELVASTPERLEYSVQDDPAFPTELGGPESVRFATGTLRIEGPDGDSLTLRADNGDLSTANVEVSVDGSVSSFVEPWATWAEALDFSFELR